MFPNTQCEWRIQKIQKGEASASQVGSPTDRLAIFPRKIHEHERSWKHIRSALDSANAVVLFRHFYCLLLQKTIVSERIAKLRIVDFGHSRYWSTFLYNNKTGSK